MKYIRGFGQFWYDFLIGDDWKIAAAVLTVLGIGVAVVKHGGYNSHVLTALLAAGVVVTFTAALLIDVRRSGRDD